MEMSKGGSPTAPCPAGQGGAQGCSMGGKSSPACSWRAVGLRAGQGAVSGLAAELGLPPALAPRPTQCLHRGSSRDEES